MTMKTVNIAVNILSISSSIAVIVVTVVVVAEVVVVELVALYYL